jgi:hypothetical protein
MCGTNNVLARRIKKSIGLVIHLHGHMAASIKVGKNLSLETNGKSSAGLPAMDHIKWNGQTAF